MHAEIKGSLLLSTVTPEVVIGHGDDSVSFSVSIFGRVSFKKEFGVFSEINQYWETLPTEQQDIIFSIYKDIHLAYDEIVSTGELSDYISKRVADLLSFHQLDNVASWLAFRGNIVVPPGFEDEYKSNIDTNNSREKTYTRKDYLDLVAMSLVLRVMVPIWGEYIANTRREKGTHFKEFYAFQLLGVSGFLNCTPMTKLMTYVENIIGVNNFRPDNTLKWISSEDFIHWLTALVCIKKLTVADLRGTDPDGNIVTTIYKYSKQRADNTDNDFKNLYKEKKFSESPGNMESKLSSLELYKIKTDISPGEIVELEHSVKNLFSVAQKLAVNVTPELFDRSTKTVQVLRGKVIQPVQLILLSWVFKPVISPKGLMYLPKHTIVNMLGVLEAVLWTRGHKYLAVLVTSYANISDSELIISPVDSKTRVDKDLVEELSRHYPYTTPKSTSKRKSVRLTAANTVEVNIVTDTIDKYADQLTLNSWRTTCAPTMAKEVFGQTTRRCPVYPDVKDYITKLVIELGSNNYI